MKLDPKVPRTLEHVAQISNLLYRRFLTCIRPALQPPVHPSPARSADWKSATQQIGNLRYPRQRAYMLMEALAYITVLLVLMGVGFAALYRCIDSSIALRRSAGDLTAAIHAGERWRADIRSAEKEPWLDTTAYDPILHIPRVERVGRNAPPPTRPSLEI